MIIRSNRVMLGQKICAASLEFEDGKIMAVADRRDCDVDYGDSLICPGFLDIHYHGCYGNNVMDKDAAALERMCQSIPSEGTTSWLGTTTSMPKDEIAAALERLGTAKGKNISGAAELLGVHLEGPFLDPNNGGAQSAEYMVSGDATLLEWFNAVSGNSILRVTVSPEILGAEQVIASARSQGIVVSVGHSAATYDQSKAAIAAGATCATHTLNKMSTITGRDPGLLGAALLTPQMYCEVIADGVHLHYDTIRLIWSAKGSERMILVTDSNMAKGMAAGQYSFNGREVSVDEYGTARIVKSGSLAGSTARMNVCLRNMVNNVGVPLVDAIQMTSKNPAKLLGLDNRKGALEVGFDADITVMDENFDVIDTYCNGVAAPIIGRKA